MTVAHAYVTIPLQQQLSHGRAKIRCCTMDVLEETKKIPGLGEASKTAKGQLLDDLSLRQLGRMLSDVRAHYRESGKLDQDRVCMNLLATRLSDLHLNRCKTGPSTLPGDTGTGLFATRAIQAGELITLYPGDALLYWKDGNRDIQNGRICSGVIFGAHVLDEERNAERVTTNDARRYELQASATISCVGDPRLGADPAYLGHFANDGSTCAVPADVAQYDASSKTAANADHVNLEGCQLATQATRPIEAGEEIFVSYGAGHWLTHSGFDLNSPSTGSHASKSAQKKKAGKAEMKAQKGTAKGKVKTDRKFKGFGRAGTTMMNQLSAGEQFIDRPMKDINKAGPSERHIARVQKLMAELESSGRIQQSSAARAMVAAKRAEVASKPKMDAELEEEHRSQIELAKAAASQMMSNGNIDGAIEALRVVRPWLCTVTELGSSVLLDLAMALDAKRDPEAQAIFASLSRSPSKEVRSMAKMMASVDSSEDFMRT